MVEVIVSIALIGIIATLVVTIFVAGLFIARESGDNTKVTGNASGTVENALGGAIITPVDEELQVDGMPVGTGTYAEDDTVEATIEFSGIHSKTIGGTLVTVTSDSELNDTTMKAYIPAD